ncbi:MAG: L-arabinose isomerase, partial [Actinomycetota bacterium]
MSQIKNAPKQIWFLTGSQNLYGPETLAQVAEQSQAVVAALAENLDGLAELVWKPILKTQDEVKRAMADASASDDCIGIVVWMHTFSPAKMWINGLSILTKPLLHLHTQANQALPWSTIDMDFMNLNQAAHGDREHGHIQARFDRGRKIVVGHYDSPVVHGKIRNWIRAAIGWNTAQNLRLARFGDNMRYVAVTDGDKTSAQMKFGFSVEAFAVNDLVAEVERVTEAQVDALVAIYCEKYELAPELAPGAARHDSLRYAARQEIAMRGFLERGNFTAFTTNFEDLGG